MRKVFLNALLMATSVLFALLAGEAAVRLVMPRDEIAEWYQAHPEYHHVLKPNFHQRYTYRRFGATMDVQTNAQGFRDEVRAPAAGEAARVLFLGDSFVFGYGLDLDDRMDTVLRALADEAGMPFETVNWGVPGWGTSHQARFAADHLQVAAPDLLVLLFCNNDPANDSGLGLPALPNLDSALYSVKTWLRRHAHLYRLLLEWRGAARARAELGGADPAEPARPDGSPYDITPQQWQQTTVYIERIYDELKAVNPDAAMVLLSASPEDDIVKERLSTIAESGGQLHYLDLEPHIAHLSAEERRMPWDGHWSPAVHSAAARAILEWVRTQ